MGVIETQRVFVDYGYYICYEPRNALRLLLGEKVEDK